MADKVNISGFIDALAIFIKQKRVKAREVDNIGDEQRKKADLSQARKYPIQVHSFITTWKAKGDNKKQVQYKHQTMQCVFEWQKSKEDWQYDYVQIQKWPTRAKNS